MNTLSTPRTGVDESVLAEAYWYWSRLVNHGWRLGQCSGDGGGYVSADTPAGPVVVRGGGVGSLASQLCGALEQLARKAAVDGGDYLHHLSVMVRLHHPARRLPLARLRPWPIPGHDLAEQPGEAVRVAYWLASMLTDDYGWQITAVAATGFTAVLPGQPSPQRFGLRRRDDGTTAAELVRRLAALSTVERRCLHRLVAEHARKRAGGRRICTGGVR